MRLTLASLSTLALAGASLAASPASAARPARALPAAVDVLVSRSGDSPVSFQTFPGARCILSSARSKAKLTVYADDRGSVTFHVTPTRGAAANGSLIARCDVRGNVTSTAVRIHVVARAPRPLAARLAFDARPLVPRGMNPATLTDTDVTRLQLPPRPDARRDPKSYSEWLRAVTTPVRRIGGSTVLRPDVVHGPARTTAPKGHVGAAGNAKNSASTANWSGIADIGGYRQFAYWVAGQWTVPYATTNSYNNAAYSAVWTGIDGDGSTDVIQNGTEQDAYFDGYFGFAFADYSAWYEYYPDSGSTTLSNFNVNPGDQIFAESWLCHEDNGLNVGCYYMEDETQGEATPVYSEIGASSALVAGNSAEWVVERPLIDGRLPPLAQLTAVAFTLEDVYDEYLGDLGGETNSCVGNQTTLWMYNGADELASAYQMGCENSVDYWNAFE